MPTIGLVLNVLEVVVNVPAQIMPGCVLRKPTAPELERFRAALQVRDPTGFVKTAFECDPPATMGEYRLRDPTDWRYWVVEATAEHAAGDTALYNVAKMSRLCSVELPCANMVLRPDFGPDSIGWGHGIGFDPLIRFVRRRKPELLDQAAVDQIRETWGRFSALDPAHAPIAAAVELYASLGPMWSGKLFHPLGVFAAMESLLTHDSRGGYDSLTHQISTKMSLLDNRFATRLDYSSFGDTESDKIWKLLYAYRSAIAHGGKPDFKGRLSDLKDDGTAVAFLDYAARMLLRHALQEPQLVLDLRSC